MNVGNGTLRKSDVILSLDTMNIWNKVLIGLICFLAVLATFWTAKDLSSMIKSKKAIALMAEETRKELGSIEESMNYD